MSVKVYTKDPNEKLDYPFNWANWLAYSTGDTIATAAWTVPAGLTTVSVSNTTTLATIWLSGGVAGTDYTVDCKITTAQGRTAERSIILAVRER